MQATASPVKKRKSPSIDTDVFGDSTNQREVGSPHLKRKKGDGSVDVNEDKNVIGPVLYSPGELLPPLQHYFGSLLEVRVPGEHLSLSNPQVVSRQLWGSQGEYTSDSDVVAILYHSGIQMAANPAYLKVYLAISTGKGEYLASNSNGIQSRAWSQHAVTLSVDHVSPFFRTPETEDQVATSFPMMDLSSIILPNTTMKFNLSNDLSLQYDLTLLCDRGTEREKWTSYKLKSFILFLETATDRYELCKDGVKKKNDKTYDTYRWSQVKQPLFLSQSKFGRFSKIADTTFITPESTSISLPLPQDHLTVLHTNLDWSDFLWGSDSLQLKGQHYSLETLFWLPRMGSSR